jgi:hypothetical protein
MRTIGWKEKGDRLGIDEDIGEVTEHPGWVPTRSEGSSRFITPFKIKHFTNQAKGLTAPDVLGSCAEPSI